MVPNKDDDKKHRLNQQDQDTEGDAGESGQGGKSGQVEFRDFLANPERWRDDQLPADEKRRLQVVHKDGNAVRVKKQSDLRKERQQVKEGKISLQASRQGQGNGFNSEFRRHPLLSQKAQFSGIDRQTNSLPTENISETNEEKREELQQQYQLRYQPQNTPRFNPKPQYR